MKGMVPAAPSKKGKPVVRSVFRRFRPGPIGGHPPGTPLTGRNIELTPGFLCFLVDTIRFSASGGGIVDDPATLGLGGGMVCKAFGW